MLVTLRVSGFAIVDAVEVRFGPGLNVLTGETGAGKSVLVNALHLVLGGRMTADVLREGAEEAVVEALFELDAEHPVLQRLRAAGVNCPEPDQASGKVELLVRRVASRGGRGRVFVNGSLLTVGILEMALAGLIDISGQHEHVSLLDPATHLDLLDDFLRALGPASISPDERGSLLGRYRAGYAKLAALVREREAITVDEGERARRKDYLSFLLRELDAVDPKPQEVERLEDERRVLSSAEKLRKAAQLAESLAYGEEASASVKVGQAARVLAEAAALDARLESPLGLLRSATAELEEAGHELLRYHHAVAGDPDRLREVEDRLLSLRMLQRKHGGTLEALLERRAGMRRELASLESGGERLVELAAEIGSAGEEALAASRALSEARTAAAHTFAESVRRELGVLAMGSCRLEVLFSVPDEGVELGGRRLGQNGAEKAEILIAPNLGEPARPLARIASGGELSRLLLAIKRTLAQRAHEATHVFDEVDAGLGGAVAEATGRALADVAKNAQVICITHLPQVAAFADRHLRVDKQVVENRTVSTVVPLESEAARCGEVARLLAGSTVTGSALEHAGALIAQARRKGGLSGRAGRSGPVRSAIRNMAG